MIDLSCSSINPDLSFTFQQLAYKWTFHAPENELSRLKIMIFGDSKSRLVSNEWINKNILNKNIMIFELSRDVGCLIHIWRIRDMPHDLLSDSCVL